MLAVNPVFIGWTGELVFGGIITTSALDGDHWNEKDTQKLYAEQIYIYKQRGPKVPGQNFLPLSFQRHLPGRYWTT